MGLADRDYARSDPGGGFRGPGVPGFGRVGGFHLISVNTWLIIANVAVFILGNILLANVLVPISYGVGYYPGVTDAQRARGQVDTSVAYPEPGQQGIFFYPILDPSARDPFGRVAIDPRTNRRADMIGRQRFARPPVIQAIGHFSTGKAFAELQLWRFLSFQFLHANFAHLLLNMLGLWFVGEMVERRLGRRRYLAFYLLCGAAGALMYLALNLLGYSLQLQLPFVLINDPYTPLVGASAGVFGVLMAAAALYPREIVYVMLLLPMRLRTAVYLFLAFAIYNLVTSGDNAGGDAAHVGGALAGALLIRRPYLLSEVVGFFTFSRRGRADRPTQPAPRPADEVDRILDKVAARGRDSLTPAELETLRRAAGRLERP